MANILTLWDVPETMEREALEAVLAFLPDNRLRLGVLEPPRILDGKPWTPDSVCLKDSDAAQLAWAELLFVPVLAGELLAAVEQGSHREPMASLILTGLYQKKKILCLPFAPFLEERIRRLGVTILCKEREAADRRGKRRILTGADVRRCGASEIVLASGDIVTDIAKEEAEKKGIVIQRRDERRQRW